VAEQVREPTFGGFPGRFKRERSMRSAEYEIRSAVIEIEVPRNVISVSGRRSVCAHGTCSMQWRIPRPTRVSAMSVGEVISAKTTGQNRSRVGGTHDQQPHRFWVMPGTREPAGQID